MQKDAGTRTGTVTLTVERKYSEIRMDEMGRLESAILQANEGMLPVEVNPDKSQRPRQSRRTFHLLECHRRIGSHSFSKAGLC
jgi:hypothetical protein